VRREYADIALDPDLNTGVIEHSDRVSLLHIVGIEDLETPAQSTRGNGAGQA
jgi:hypothetical protein